MKLKREIIERLRCRDNRHIKVLLAEALDVSVSSIPRWIYANESNGKLTTVKALKIISEGLGVPVDEMLVE